MPLFCGSNPMLMPFVDFGDKGFVGFVGVGSVLMVVVKAAFG